MFSEFAATVPEIFWIREAGSEQILYVNPAWEQITGHPRPQDRNAFFRIIHPDDAERVTKAARDSPSGGVDHKYRIVRPDGSVRWLHFRTFALRNGAGEIYRIAGIGRDVTEEVGRDQELGQFRAAVDASADLVTLIDPRNMRYIDINDATCRALGYAREELLAMGPGDVFSVPGSDLAQAYERLNGDRTPSSVEGIYRRKDGSTFPVEASRRVIASADGNIIVAIARDITLRRKAEDDARSQKLQQLVIAEFAQQALGSADLEKVMNNAVEIVSLTLTVDHSRILRVDPDGKSLALRFACGWPAELIGQRAALPGAHTQTGRVLSRREGVIVRNYASDTRFSVSEADSSHLLSSGIEVPIPGQKSSPVGVLGAYSQRLRVFTTDEINFLHSLAGMIAVAIERKGADERLSYMAQFDALTELPNRHLFLDRLVHAMAQARRSKRPMAVLFIDLDRFKLVNDTQGHRAGDALLKEVAARLSRSVRGGDTVGRFGGDEFGAILVDLAQPGDASLVAQKILDALARPIPLEGHETYITASIGITLHPTDGTDPEALIANADVAMYRAKEQGRNHYQYFTQEMNERALRRAQMEAALHRALEREEFRLYYQPKADLATGKICGFEALLRWQHPERGLESPADFIPVLEETGLIVPAGEWVLRTACAQIKAWQEAGLPVLPVAVNLSARQFQHKELEAGVRSILAETGVHPSLIQFELTESLLAKDPEGAVRTLLGLKELGVKLSVDDFGTGYSSLAYLKRFPLNELKIDRVFIRDIASNPDDAAITLAIISLAHSLNLKVVAEGVETEAQLNFLRSHGCDDMQGFYFARPQPAADCTQALIEGRCLQQPAAQDRDGAPVVLIVDDDENDLVLIRKALEPSGYRIQTANGAEAGFDILAKNAFQIVISDHHLRGMSGVAFLAGVRTLYPDAVRIAISGTADVGSVTDAVNEAGIHKYISKGWDANRLRAEVREAYLRSRETTV